MVTLDTRATGANIKLLVRKNNLKLDDVAGYLGFNTSQAVCKWYRGDSMPTLDNLVMLAELFGVGVDDILVLRRV